MKRKILIFIVLFILVSSSVYASCFTVPINKTTPEGENITVIGFMPIEQEDCKWYEAEDKEYFFETCGRIECGTIPFVYVSNFFECLVYSSMKPNVYCPESCYYIFWGTLIFLIGCITSLVIVMILCREKQ